MKLRVIGAANPTLRRDLRSIAKAVIDDLVRPGIAENLQITINIKNSNMEGALGYCLPRERNHLPRNFLIELYGKVNKKQLMQTLVHELVHVKQFAHNELKFYRMSSCSRWEDIVIGEETDYWDQPWEVEARAFEKPLFDVWVLKNNLNDKKWTQHAD